MASVEKILSRVGIAWCTVRTESPSSNVRVIFRPDLEEPEYEIAIATPAARELAQALLEAADDAEADWPLTPEDPDYLLPPGDPSS